MGIRISRINHSPISSCFLDQGILLLLLGEQFGFSRGEIFGYQIKFLRVIIEDLEGQKKNGIDEGWVYMYIYPGSIYQHFSPRD